MNVSASEVVSQVPCTQVYRMLGGPPPRNKRYLPFWRDGKHYNVAINDEKAVWYDFSRAEGGGILDLISKALDCDRRTALRWLADQLHVDVNQPLTPAERHALRERQRRYAWLEDRRRRLIRQLTWRRNYFWDYERRVSLWAAENMDKPDDPRWELVWLHCQDDQKGDIVQAEIDRIEAMTLDELAAFLAEAKGKAA